jgi:hypothetical protein
VCSRESSSWNRLRILPQIENLQLMPWCFALRAHLMHSTITSHPPRPLFCYIMACSRHQIANQLRVELAIANGPHVCPTFSEIQGLNMFLKQSVAVEDNMDPEFCGALVMRDTDHRAEWCGRLRYLFVGTRHSVLPICAYQPRYLVIPIIRVGHGISDSHTTHSQEAIVASLLIRV